MDARLNEEEAAVVKRLAELFEKNVTWISIGDEKAKALELSGEKWETVLATMEHIGAITNPSHTTGGRFVFFTITANAVQIAREIRAKEATKPEPRDIVAEMKDSVRRHPVMAWILIGFFALTTLAAFVASILTIIDKVIELKKKW